jgi:hypothetical protein
MTASRPDDTAISASTGNSRFVSPSLSDLSDAICLLEFCSKFSGFFRVAGHWMM